MYWSSHLHIYFLSGRLWSCFLPSLWNVSISNFLLGAEVVRFIFSTPPAWSQLPQVGQRHIHTCRGRLGDTHKPNTTEEFMCTSTEKKPPSNIIFISFGCSWVPEEPSCCFLRLLPPPQLGKSFVPCSGTGHERGLAGTAPCQRCLLMLQGPEFFPVTAWTTHIPKSAPRQKFDHTVSFGVSNFYKEEIYF